MTSRRRRVTERRRLRRWRWLRQRRHFSLRRRRLRGCCCSSQHPWRGHFSPILAEWRKLQPLLQQFEFQFFFFPGSTSRSRRGEAEDAATGPLSPPSASARLPFLQPPPPLTRLRAARRPGPAAAAGGSLREARLPAFPAPERPSAPAAGMAPGLRSG